MFLTTLADLAVFWLYVTLICSFLHHITFTYQLVFFSSMSWRKLYRIAERILTFYHIHIISHSVSTSNILIICKNPKISCKQLTSARPSKPRPVSHCRVLPPGEYNQGLIFRAYRHGRAGRSEIRAWKFVLNITFCRRHTVSGCQHPIYLSSVKILKYPVNNWRQPGQANLALSLIAGCYHLVNIIRG